MKTQDCKFVGKSTRFFNELVDANISKILDELLQCKNANEIKELIHMIDVLRMTRKK